MRTGTIVFVVGPSGAGKDSLLRYAANQLSDDPRFAFPRRVITREPTDQTERHDTITTEEFAHAVRQGRFALHWEAHGLRYGIPASIDDDLDVGRTVAVNVSRNILAEGVRRYPDHLIICVTAPAPVLAQRLAARGREGRHDIAARISRRTDVLPEGLNVVTITNDRSLEEAGERFMRLLRDPKARRETLFVDTKHLSSKGS